MSFAKKSFFLLWIFLFIPNPEVQSQNVTIHDSIEGIIRAVQNTGGLWIGCEHIHAHKPLKVLYQNRNFEPFWITPSGPSSLGLELFDFLADAGSHGLNPHDYHFSCIRKWFESIDQRKDAGRTIGKKELAGLDIVMTDAFLNFGFHLAAGKVDPKSIFPQWFVEKNKVDIFDALNRLCPEKSSVKRVLKCLAPPHPDYWQMVKAAKGLKTVQEAEGWPMIPKGQLLRPGDISSRVIPLSRRLCMEGYLPHGLYEEQKQFDRNLVDAVKAFQANHGLVIDGIVGPNTLKALNVPAGERRKQILINLERWRWLPRNLGEQHIRVNIAAFTLNAVNRGIERLAMRVIVGKNYQKTPLFSKKMAYVQFNPYWNVPWSIVKEELLPKFKADPDYMIKNHYELVDGWNPESPVISSGDIQWESVHVRNFPGRIRQLPGPWNAMGRVKFMFPNQFNVYLHDTSSSSRHLFQKANRALSHGCIRVEKPVDLAVFLLRDSPDWNRRRIEAVIQNGQQLAVPVPGRCMVHLLYYTAWMNDEGKINYRRDIYGRDAILWDALQRLPADGAPAKPNSDPVLKDYSLELECHPLCATRSGQVPHQYE